MAYFKNIMLISALVFSSIIFAGEHNHAYEQKILDAQEQNKFAVGWYDTRLITPGTHFYIKDENNYKLHKKASDNIELKLYKQTLHQSNLSRSHGLLTTSTGSMAVSVDAAIRTPTKRCDEKKATHVQYDKTATQQEYKDFKISANNDKGEANYDGGHLADHKFSAQGSHTDNANYVPQHHFYNRWLKEYLVKDASGYLEIPLFTSNPPTIKVLGENKYDRIPVGILLVLLKNQGFQDVYYFPNNQYNYRTLQRNLKINKSIARQIAPCFKLKKEFHKLLWPAIIHDIKARDSNLAHQLVQEEKGAWNMSELIDGMAVLDLEEDEYAVSTLASNVIHRSNVNLPIILDTKEIPAMNSGQENNQALSQSFNALGQFLVDYAMKNALKSEMLSTHSRIMFADIITDFIECHHQVCDNALKHVNNTFKDVYPATLEELWAIRSKMNLEDLIYFANLYQKLSSPSIHDSLENGDDIVGDMDIETNLEKFVNILKDLYIKTGQEESDESQIQNMVNLFLEAQASLAYIINTGFPAEIFENEIKFLGFAKKRVKYWDKLSSSTNGTYQTSPNSTCSFRKIESLSADEISYLGTISSIYCHNDDSEDEEEDSSESESEYETEDDSSEY